MKNYVVGFYFAHARSWGTIEDQFDLVLIRKLKPDWQRGKLNGIGGKVEPGETALLAMEREWTEETGTNSPKWKPLINLQFPETDASIYFFVSFGKPLPVRTVEIEEVSTHPVSFVMRMPDLMPNLNWLIPMALHDDDHNLYPVIQYYGSTSAAH